ncbi:MAG TPA: ferritin [Pseudonocardiaceae bacterium]|jgi:ferritin|nr:ferritin [Pseudonocardiaceae bacterium]
MPVSAKKITKRESAFHTGLRDQVRNELTAAQQYLAVAVWFDRSDLPRLAAHFYRQSLEERNHAMMIVRYLMDNDLDVTIPGVDEVRNDFTDAAETIALALEQEREVSREIAALAMAARDERDYTGEQFVQWFLKEQVEEIAQMSTLLNVVKRSSGNMFDVEGFLYREHTSVSGPDHTAPPVAGGHVG